MNTAKILLLLASASVAYSRPGETSGEIQQRFGQPLTEKVRVESSGGGVPAKTQSKIFTVKKEEYTVRELRAKPLTTSLRETSRIYQFGELKVTVYFFDNRSQREEYKREKHTPGQRSQDVSKTEGFEKILAAVGNAAAWETELNAQETRPNMNSEFIYQNDKPKLGNYKMNGLRAWVAVDLATLIVETDAFRSLRLAQPTKKPDPKLGEPIPGKGKGL